MGDKKIKLKFPKFYTPLINHSTSGTQTFQKNKLLIHNLFENKSLQNYFANKKNITASSSHQSLKLVNSDRSNNEQNNMNPKHNQSPNGDTFTSSFITYLDFQSEKKKIIPNIMTHNKISAHKLTLKKANLKKIFFDDEKIFTPRGKHGIQPFIFPKKTYKIRENLMSHDCNFYNKKFMLNDFSNNYQRYSFKYKDLFEKQKEIDVYKEDLSRMKFNRAIRVFDNFKNNNKLKIKVI